jgi:hypothetical protein
MEDRNPFWWRLRLFVFFVLLFPLLRNLILLLLLPRAVIRERSGQLGREGRGSGAGLGGEAGWNIPVVLLPQTPRLNQVISRFLLQLWRRDRTLPHPRLCRVVRVV